MAKKVETCQPNVKLKDALKKMVRRNIGCVIVMEKDQPIGIVTERDVSKQLSKGVKTLNFPVSKLMSKPLIHITTSASPQYAIELMVRNGIRRLPVMEAGRLIGIITERDVFRWILKVTYQPSMPPDIEKIVVKRSKAAT